MVEVVHTNEGAAALTTEDIERFWRAIDAAPATPLAEALNTHYLQPATPGLGDFLACRIFSADALANITTRSIRIG